MMNVDHADRLALVHQRNGKKRLVSIFDQRRKNLEARIGRRVGRQRHQD